MVIELKCEVEISGVSVIQAGEEGGYSYIDMVCPAFWDAFLHILVQINEGFSLQMTAPNLHRLSVFYENHHKKHLVWAKLGVFFNEFGK